ncbi:MAG: hypothetical protein ACKESB_01420 [Candidatus Hodgkinia cicadicola]
MCSKAELFPFLKLKVKAYLMMRYEFCGLTNVKREDGGMWWF